jgi:RNA polymerase sigma-70 factor (ECF subfamily)
VALAAPSLEVETHLEVLVDEARAAWPGIGVAPVVFVRYLGARLPPDVDPAAALGQVHASDLYLACGLAAGDRAALAAFETRFLGRVAAWVAAYQPTPAFVDEVRQLLRERLLVGVAGGPPKIVTYAGGGPLRSWLRVAAVRVAIDLRRQGVAAPLADAGSLELAAGTSDPELHLMRTRHRGAIEAAFRTTLAGLGRRERTLLRLFFLDGLTTAQIGAVFKVDASTVSRWIAAARRTILAETRRRLVSEGGVAEGELTSVLRLARTRLEVTIARYLGGRPRGS